MKLYNNRDTALTWLLIFTFHLIQNLSLLKLSVAATEFPAVRTRNQIKFRLIFSQNEQSSTQLPIYVPGAIFIPPVCFLRVIISVGLITRCKHKLTKE